MKLIWIRRYVTGVTDGITRFLLWLHDTKIFHSRKKATFELIPDLHRTFLATRLCRRIRALRGLGYWWIERKRRFRVGSAVWGRSPGGPRAASARLRDFLGHETKLFGEISPRTLFYFFNTNCDSADFSRTPTKSSRFFSETHARVCSVQIWSGVPQGSVLGSLLFIVCTADLKTKLRSPFAMHDDIKLYDYVQLTLEFCIHYLTQPRRL